MTKSCKTQKCDLPFGICSFWQITPLEVYLHPVPLYTFVLFRDLILPWEKMVEGVKGHCGDNMPQYPIDCGRVHCMAECGTYHFYLLDFSHYQWLRTCMLYLCTPQVSIVPTGLTTGFVSSSLLTMSDKAYLPLASAAFPLDDSCISMNCD